MLITILCYLTYADKLTQTDRQTHRQITSDMLTDGYQYLPFCTRYE